MNLWSLLGAVFFAALFGLFAYFRFDSLNSMAVKGIAAFAIVGFYGAIVIFGTAEKKRTLSLAWQTLLGMFASLTIAVIYQAPDEGMVAAAVLGLILGFFADKWAVHLQLP
jgi:hypothetical protein